MTKKTLINISIILILIIIIFFIYKNKNSSTKINNPVASSTVIENSNPNEVKYVNPTYGFMVSLPESWLGFTSTITEWQGSIVDPKKGEVVTEIGPIIHIRDPKYTEANPRQDIPVMVFTLAQWNALIRDEFHIGAAPINPSMLSFTDNYVFALPARYNFALLPGYEEVAEILKGAPVKPTSPTSTLSANEQILLCGGIPNGSTETLRDTSRIFINLPRDIYPDKANNLQFQTISGSTTSGYISNGGLPGEAFGSTPECFSYYNEFDSVGKIDLRVKSVDGENDYLVHFKVVSAN